jgi:DNA-directed RNA polymerase specialized sigma subunit
MDKEALEKAQKAIDKLPAMRKRVYELVIVGKLTNKEVAAQLNISEQYVLNSISVVHRTVKEHLSQQLATMLLVISYFI